MALSNIFREPRREIIETGIGAIVALATLSGGLTIDYMLACVWRFLAPSIFEGTSDLILAMAVIPVCGVAGFGVLFVFGSIVHAVGEDVCAAIERRGVQLRPRQRD